MLHTILKLQNRPAVEFVRVLLASLVEIQTQIGVDADAKVVVHDKDGRRVLVLLSRFGVVRQRHLRLVGLLLIRMKYHCPSAHTKSDTIMTTTQGVS